MKSINSLSFSRAELLEKRNSEDVPICVRGVGSDFMGELHRDQTVHQCKLGVCSLAGAERTIQGYEAMHMIRKGEVRWLAKDDIAEQVRFEGIFSLTT